MTARNVVTRGWLGQVGGLLQPSPAQPMAAWFVITPHWPAGSTSGPSSLHLLEHSNVAAQLQGHYASLVPIPDSGRDEADELILPQDTISWDQVWSNHLRRGQPQYLNMPWAPTQGRERVSRPGCLVYIRLSLQLAFWVWSSGYHQDEAQRARGEEG